MMKIVNKITVEDITNGIGHRNVTFGELLVESYEYDYDNNNNDCILHSAVVVIPVYGGSDYSKTLKFTLHLDETTCAEDEIDERLHELLQSKVDEQISQ